MSSNEWSNSSSRSSSIAPQEFDISNDLIENHFSDHTITGRSEDKSSLIDSLKPLIGRQNETNNGNNNNSKRYLLECRVCGSDASVFFCSSCVRNGDFTYSNSKQRIPERFAEKKLKYFGLKSEQNIISDKIDKQLNDCVIRDELKYRIRLTEAKAEELRNSLTKAKQKLCLTENDLKKTKLSQNECKERHNKLMAKLKDAKQYLVRRQSSITKKHESRDKNDSLLKELIGQRVNELTTYIFPIETKDSVNESNERNTTLSCESTPLLEPISDSNTFNINYTVVEPWISGNGDYSAFALFASNERDFPNRESNFRNSKYRICAALAYVTQLMNIIAFYLDIRLPKRLSYSEFFLRDLNELQFTHKVAKLNANIMYLCLSQNVDSELLNPRQTVKNLLFLLNSSTTLGIRNGPIVVRADFLESLENCLLDDLYLIDETDLEEDVNDQNDENLIIEYDWVENNLPDLQLNISSQQTSIASGVISTFTSMWRAAIGQK